MWLAFFASILAAWGALFAVVRGNDIVALGAVPDGFWASLCIAAAGVQPLAVWAMWALMAAAMMLPTFVPALRTWFDLRAAGAATTAGAVALVGGYLAVWLGVAGLGAAAQIALSRAGLVSPLGASVTPWLTVGLLIGAGLYQFTALKAACLAKCRMPMTFFMERWRPGTPAAFGMGLRLGVLCFGCCWALMALAFVGGTMNLLWMGAATLFMVTEKLPEVGRWITGPMGAALIAGGGAQALLIATG